MRYDRFDMTLHATVDELAALVEHQVRRRPPPAEWDDGGVTIAGILHPAVVQIVQVAALPCRVATIERFDVEPAAPIHVGWDEHGRAVLTRALDGDVTITATRLELLPALLAQLLRLGPPEALADRRLVLTTAGAIDDAIVAIGSGAPPDSALGLLASFVGAWRVTGGWSNHPVDRSVTVLDAGPAGLWSVEPLGSEEEPTAVTEVMLRPLDHDDALATIGDVVTGRATARRLAP